MRKKFKDKKRPEPVREKLAEREALMAINIKLSQADRLILTQKAKQFADGNLSAWLRYTGQMYTPEPWEEIPGKSRK
jgi:hypothetical protein